jgi:hypothetical protein
MMNQLSSSLLKYQSPYCHCVVEGDSTVCYPRCRVIVYCSGDYVAPDWLAHNTSCLHIQQAQRDADEELSKLQSKCHRCFLDISVEPDHFWEWKDIRSYIQAKRRLIDALCNIPTERALQTALQHGLDILRLNTSDNMDVKLIIPDIMIRLDMDFEAEDFIRRFSTVSSTCQYAWAHLDLVLPEPQGEKIVECRMEMDLVDECMPLAFKLALVLLKLRLLFCLRDLQNALALLPIFPPEIVRLIQDHLAAPAVKSNPRLWKAIRAGSSLHEEMSRLENELHRMFEATGAHKPNLWPALAVSKELSTADTRLTSLPSRHAWIGTRGALKWIREKIELANL